MAKQNLTEYRVTTLESTVKSQGKDIRLVLEIHLPEVDKKIIALSTQIKMFTAVNVLLVILTIILTRLFR